MDWQAGGGRPGGLGWAVMAWLGATRMGGAVKSRIGWGCPGTDWRRKAVEPWRVKVWSGPSRPVTKNEGL